VSMILLFSGYIAFKCGTTSVLYLFPFYTSPCPESALCRSTGCACFHLQCCAHIPSLHSLQTIALAQDHLLLSWSRNGQDIHYPQHHTATRTRGIPSPDHSIHSRGCNASQPPCSHHHPLSCSIDDEEGVPHPGPHKEDGLEVGSMSHVAGR
jgi:hypothetical protein